MINFICTVCKGTHFRVYCSRNIVECDKCHKEYNLREVSDLQIKHQR